MEFAQEDASNLQSNWYALYVYGGREDQIKELLEARLGKLLSFHVIKRLLKERKDGKWRFVEKKLFPNYILMNGYIDDKVCYHIHQINQTIARVNILRAGNDFLTIDNRELMILDILKNNEDVVEISSLYRENDKIKVVDGPLVGLEGHIQNINKRKGRAKVSLDFIGEKRVIDLGIKIVEKI